MHANQRRWKWTCWWASCCAACSTWVLEARPCVRVLMKIKACVTSSTGLNDFVFFFHLCAFHSVVAHQIVAQVSKTCSYASLQPMFRRYLHCHDFWIHKSLRSSSVSLPGLFCHSSGCRSTIEGSLTVTEWDPPVFTLDLMQTHSCSYWMISSTRFHTRLCRGHSWADVTGSDVPLSIPATAVRIPNLIKFHVWNADEMQCRKSAAAHQNVNLDNLSPNNEKIYLWKI